MAEPIYLRATAYHKERDFSIIVDAPRIYERKWMLGTCLLAGGFSVLKVSTPEDIQSSSFPLTEPVDFRIILRAVAKGQPDIQGNTYSVADKTYTIKD